MVLYGSKTLLRFKQIIGLHLYKILFFIFLILGNDRKMERAKKFGHWFLKDDGRSCDIKQVSKMTRTKT
ncbi:hypothetical protein ACF0H5_004628 [Mactra antiquata]